MVTGSGEIDREADSQAAQAEVEPAEDDSIRFYGPGYTIREVPGKGYGVFIEEDLVEGELIFCDPALPIPADEVGTVLSGYVYDYDDGINLLAIGVMSYLNHSNQANCRYEADELSDGRPYIELIAHRNIKAGEELTINYNGKPDDPTPWDFTEEESEE